MVKSTVYVIFRNNDKLAEIKRSRKVDIPICTKSNGEPLTPENNKITLLIKDGKWYDLLNETLKSQKRIPMVYDVAHAETNPQTGNVTIFVYTRSD